MNVMMQPLRLPTEEEAILSQRSNAVKTVSSVLRSGEHGVDTLPAALLRAIRLRAWEGFETPLGNVYTNRDMREWIIVKPPQGLGSSVERVRQLLTATERADEALVAFDREIRGEHGGAREGAGRKSSIPDEPAGIKDNNVILEKSEPRIGVGNSAQQGLRRLDKAAQDGDEKAAALLAEVIDNAVSVNAACIAMGFRKPPPDVVETVRRAWRKASSEERQQIAEFIDEQTSALAGSRFK